MTEYEVADIAASVLANFLTSLTVFLSIVSAYVISAFVAGQRLTKIQLSIVNLCFLVAVGGPPTLFAGSSARWRFAINQRS